MREGAMLAWAMNGEDIPPPHGYPLRLIVPNWYGMTSVKWLDRITAVAEPFLGYQMMGTYRIFTGPDDPGDPVELQWVRALVRPPGIPDFTTRARLVRPGAVTLAGRAWAGRRDIARVEVSADGGESWADAKLGARVSKYAWISWSFVWHAAPGRYGLVCRATDDAGDVQPLTQAWNNQGMVNNMAQLIDVLVEPE